MKKKIIMFGIFFLIIILFYGLDIYQLFKNTFTEIELNKTKQKLINQNKELKGILTKLKKEEMPFIELLIRKELYYCKPDEFEFHFKR